MWKTQIKEDPYLEECLAPYKKVNQEWDNRFPNTGYLYDDSIEFLVNSYLSGEIKKGNFEEKLFEVINLIEDTIYALTAFSNFWYNKHRKNKRKKEADQKIKISFYSFNYLYDFPYKDDINIDNICIVSLNDCIRMYLTMSWFKSKKIELLLIDSYIRYCLKVNRETLFRQKYGLLCSTYLFSGEDSEGSYYVKSSCYHVISALFWSWVIKISLIKFIPFIQLNVVGWLFSFIVYFCYKGFFSFTAIKRTNKILKELFKAHKLIHSKVWEPSKLLRLAQRVEKYNIQTPELVPLAKKMCGNLVDIF